MAKGRRVAVLGSTGSVGQSTLEVIASHPQALQLIGLAARGRIDLLSEQVAAFQPPLVAVWDEEKARAFQATGGPKTVLTGEEGLIQLVTHPDVDVVVVATSGREALVPLVRAIQMGKRIALASKELLVMAGPLLMHLVKEHGTTLIPIDSEHVALLQCLQGASRSEIVRCIVTGSGGPLWQLPEAALKTVTREQVLAHPKWKMGPKITVDSSTLMNKGLEIIEARWLFDIPLERIQVVIHPEAVVHALLEFHDGTFLAQMGPCDMRLPIQYALSFPERWPTPLPRLQLTQVSGLHFIEPDLDRFPCLRLALEAARAGGTSCVVLNGANDAAVHAYLEGRLRYGDIPRVIEQALAQHTTVPHPTLDEILAVDEWSRQSVEAFIQGRAGHPPQLSRHG
jgi:1-deoxy-D-xylulose-5-phosphate reductoisomerase